MRLIDLSDAVNVVEGYRDRNPDSWSLCNSIKFDIAELPTISPDEARGVGEWEHQELAPTNWTFCSVCGRQRSKKYKWYYCPNCGAKMEVSEDA